MPRRVPDLRFGPGTSGGFTPAGVAAFDNLRPAAVVRELIQNALDAARNAGVSPAIVRFRLTRVSKGSIPGIKSYENAFAKAVETQEAMTGGRSPVRRNSPQTRSATRLFKTRWTCSPSSTMGSASTSNA